MSIDDKYNQNEVIIRLRQLQDNWKDGEEAYDHLLKRYFLACAHSIWKLLPQESSRNAIEITERYLIGLATDEEYSKAEYDAEGAAFNIDYNCAPADIKKWINDVKHIPHEELCKMIHPNEAIKKYKPGKLLMYAAYFAHFAMVYPYYTSLSTLGTPEKIPGEYLIFLSPSILQETLLL